MAEDRKSILISDLPEAETVEATDYIPLVHAQAGNQITYKAAVSVLRGIEIEGILDAGDTELVLEDENITEDSTVEIFTDNYKVVPTDAVVSEGSITLTFNTQIVDIKVKVRIT